MANISVSGTTGFISKFTDPSSLGNSPIDDNVTNSGAVTISKNLKASGHSAFGPDGVVDYDASTLLTVGPYNVTNIGANGYPITFDVETFISDPNDQGGNFPEGGDGNLLFLWNGVGIQDGAGSMNGTVSGTYTFVINNNNRAGKVVNGIVATWNEVDQYGNCPVNYLVNVFNEFSPNGASGNVGNMYGVWNNYRAPGAVPPTNVFGFYNSDLSPLTATNPYYEWHDSRGVRRIKEDHTFNGVGQAIETLYNPQFTKYTPGASNYERIVLGQWNSNVAEIGAEAAGSGTVHDTRVLGAAVQLPIQKQRVVFSASGTPLPSASSVGMGARAFVSDSITDAFATNYVGGGTNKVPVYSDGANWLVG